MNKRTIFWHIGFPKTATTTLQSHVFPEMKELNYLGWYYLEDREEHRKRNKLITELRKVATWYSDFHPYYLGEKDITHLINDFYPYQIDKNKNILVSDEGLISSGLTPQKSGNQVKFRSVMKGIQLTKNLSKSAGLGSKYILVIREQVELVESLFAQAYPELSDYLGIKNLEGYMDFIMEEYKWAEPRFLLHYDLLIKRLEELVGKDKLLVLPFEMLKTDPELFSNRMSEFMGLKDDDAFNAIQRKKENVRANSNGKVVNQIPLSVRIKKKIIGDVSFGGLGHKISFLDRLVEKKTKLGEHRKKQLRNTFKENNRTLVEQHPIFKKYGYV